MTAGQYSLFLSIGAWVCAAGALLNLLNVRKRGNRALLLSAAFILFACVLWLIKTNAAQVYVGALAVLVVALLVADVVLKARQGGRL